jgi:endonuclease-3
MSDLQAIVDALATQYAPPPIPTDPLQLILWENIGYLIDDQRRRELFDQFGRRIGFDPAAIAAADEEALFPIAERGGMRPDVRVERWRAIAAITLEVGGDLRAALTALPLPKARALLKRFPTIGDPGADKVLLFCGVAPRPSLESNGLRVLARLGLFQEQPNYNASYKAAIAVLTQQGLADRNGLMQAHVLLREHGKVLCRRGEPVCAPCLLEDRCPKVKTLAL